VFTKRPSQLTIECLTFPASSIPAFRAAPSGTPEIYKLAEMQLKGFETINKQQMDSFGSDM